MLVKVSLSASSFSRTTVPESPLTFTLTVSEPPDGAQVAVTVVLAVIGPLALLPSVQVCPVGCDWTLTV